MNSREAAEQLIDEIEAEFPGPETDTRVGDLIEALANVRAERAQFRAEARATFLQDRETEFEQFFEKKKAETIEARAAAAVNLVQPKR